MVLAIFTLVEHIEKEGKYFGYAPYVREMNLWTSTFEEVIVVAPRSEHKALDKLYMAYAHENVKFVKMPVFQIKSLVSIIALLIKIPKILFIMAKVMYRADHLHFRSPSNIAGIAALVQLFFPFKKKTMRYTGNWDPKSRQPIGYRFQKYLFSAPFFSKNIVAMVYGNWPKQSKNVRSFFTATYSENEKESFFKRDYKNSLKFIFTGALVEGKQPLFAIQIIERLKEFGYDSTLDIFGDGILRSSIEIYIERKGLENIITLHGNQDKETIKSTLRKSHFIILPSKSEGWPKAIAEGMFFGVIPISTYVSCLDWMLGSGSRGILIELDINSATEKIIGVLQNRNLHEMAKFAQDWSQQYTLETLENEINNVLQL
ncbi:glycosyltransferase [Winogradskyella flava]|uniref:glycosyltransferase n=1 Tax=Winogradskyella flava TaxID=1884876 RepID=UPI002493A902|nr:glycosyltransferase [Winogradskyella flava]